YLRIWRRGRLALAKAARALEQLQLVDDRAQPRRVLLDGGLGRQRLDELDQRVDVAADGLRLPGAKDVAKLTACPGRQPVGVAAPAGVGDVGGAQRGGDLVRQHQPVLAVRLAG